MSDATRKVSMSKGDGSPTAPRPTTVLVAAGASAVTGVLALIAALSLLGQKAWLLRTLTKNNAKLTKKKQVSHEQLVHNVAATQKSVLIMGILSLVIFLAIAYFVYRGRYWARWLPVAIWVLSLLQGLPASPVSIQYLFVTDYPALYKYASALSAIALLVALIASNLKPSVAFFALTKPERPAGAPQRRGLFAPRPVATPQPAAPAPRAASSADRSRSKKRASMANADAVAKGADLARARARAGKSRRSDV